MVIPNSGNRPVPIREIMQHDGGPDGGVGFDNEQRVVYRGTSQALAREVDAHLLESDSASGIAAGLQDVFERWREGAGSVAHEDAARRYSWP
jgi:hypothetical protein